MAQSDPHDVYVRITRKDRLYIALARVFALGGEVGDDGLPRPFAFAALAESPASLANPPPGFGQFIRDYISEALERAVMLPFPEQPRILLDVEPPELSAVDWEGGLDGTMLGAGRVTRFRMASDERVLRAFDLPMRVLLARQPNDPPMVRPGDSSMHYFRAHELSGIGDAELIRTLRLGHFDIVHLLADAWLQADGQAVLSCAEASAAGGGGVNVSTLSRALKSCQARFLIIQGRSAAAYAAALHVAHRIQRAGGPATLVVQDATQQFLDTFYMGVVHSQDLHSILLTKVGVGDAALFHCIRGERVLQIRPMADRLARAAQRNLDASRSLLQNLQARPSQAVEGLETAIAPTSFATVTANRLQNYVGLESNTYNFARESGAWLPIPRDARAHARRSEDIKGLRRAMGRVVNVGLLQGDRKLEPDEVLVCRRPYSLSLQIGRRAKWSLVDGAVALPEEALSRVYVAGGTQLRVVVFAERFDVRPSERLLKLRSPPHETKELRFKLRAPRTTGKYRIRICLYHKLNLLQSIVLRVIVGASAKPKPGASAIRADVEYALSSTLSSFEKLTPRRLNILMNDSGDGTHTLAVVGAKFRSSFDFGHGQMSTAVDQVRRALYEIAADTTGREPAYRFDINNSTTVPRLEQDTIRLAKLGAALYSKIIVSKRRSFAKELRKTLTQPGAAIQIASVNSARYVFPWSLVYDQPLVTGKLKLCPQFAADAQANKPVADRACLKIGCPSHGKTDVVCPSGFWGYRHLIEQPLSTNSNPEEVEPGDVVEQINGGPPGAAVSGLMVVSRDLKQVPVHENELKVAPSFAFQVRDNKVTIGESLRDPQSAAHIVYFYCHGGRNKSRTWLGIGRQEELDVSDLTNLDIDWTGVHPLVFINGCHTADFTPEDLVSFNEAFSWCRAAGVIGTEISVPEGLARAFGCGFLQRFRDGKPVGQALREQRFELLERRNLLGLAYTPYCLSALHIVQQ